jgi:hypothetical protein
MLARERSNLNNLNNNQRKIYVRAFAQTLSGVNLARKKSRLYAIDLAHQKLYVDRLFESYLIPTIMKKHKLWLNLKPDATNHFFTGVGFVEDPVLMKGKAGSQMFPVMLLSAIMGSACNKPPARFLPRRGNELIGSKFAFSHPPS